MSARTNIKTDLRDKDILVDALSKLNVNHSCHEASEKVSVSDYWNKSSSNKIEVKISKHVGFERDENGIFKLVGDTHYEDGLFSNGDSAVKKVSQVYQATQTALALEQNANFEIESSNLNNATNVEEIVIIANIR